MATLMECPSPTYAVASRLTKAGAHGTTGCGGRRHLTRGYLMPSRRDSEPWF
ncbi:MAG: hypothetical protein ACOVLE_07660 [Pirellula staleyi]